MKKFVIVTDSCSDLELELREKYDVEYIPMHMVIDDKDYEADLDWKDIGVKDFYQMMRDGKRITTAQITTEEYLNAFEKYLEKGYDVLSISCSSAFSASYSCSLKAREQLLKKYPEREIICIDSLNSCKGLGLMCITASEMRAQGKDIKEIGKWLEENKLTVNQECTVGKLTYLKQAGRVSVASAFFGGLLNIKPIIISDAIGQNAAIEKVKGKKAAIDRIAERFAEQYVDGEYQKIFFAHADCEEDLEELKTAVMNKIPGKEVETMTSCIGPIIGASTGPGTIAVYFYGKEVTFNKK